MTNIDYIAVYQQLDNYQAIIYPTFYQHCTALSCLFYYICNNSITNSQYFMKGLLIIVAKKHIVRSLLLNIQTMNTVLKNIMVSGLLIASGTVAYGAAPTTMSLHDLHTTPVYLDHSQPIEQRVEDALARMTLDEKIAIIHAQSKFTACAPMFYGMNGSRPGRPTTRAWPSLPLPVWQRHGILPWPYSMDKVSEKRLSIEERI
jgi:hypothetical protein